MKMTYTQVIGQIRDNGQFMDDSLLQKVLDEVNEYGSPFGMEAFESEDKREEIINGIFELVNDEVEDTFVQGDAGIDNDEHDANHSGRIFYDRAFGDMDEFAEHIADTKLMFNEEE